MKSLVTGASGFIGSHLVKALEARGDEVVKMRYAYFLEGQDSVRALTHDENIDLVFHLASYGNMSFQKDYVNDIFNSNLVGIMNLLMGTQDIPYKAFINVSSSSVLLKHETLYSATKAGAERLCKAFVDEYDKPIVTLRPYSVYGPGEADFRFIPTAFRSCLYGDPLVLSPEPIHDWIYVDDIVKAILYASINADSLKGYSLNTGTGIGTSNMQIITMIEEITGKKANITEYKKMRSWDTDNWVSDAESVDCIPLREGLERYYESIK